jgi:hypothetical protein
MPVPVQPKSGQIDDERVIRLEQEIQRLKEKPHLFDGVTNAPSTPSYLPWVSIIVSCAALVIALLSLLKTA